MKGARWSVQDAKNKFSSVIEAAQKRPQTVERHGKPAAVVVSVAEYERLKEASGAAAHSFADHLLAMPQDDDAFTRVRARPRRVKL